MSEHRRSAVSLQTKAMAGVVAVLVAAAVIALVFVSNGGGSGNDRAAGTPSDLGKSSSLAPSRSVDASSTARPRSTAPSTPASSTAPATTKAPAATSSAPTATRAPASSAAGQSSSAQSSSKSITYTVKKGDNLTAIAAWFHEHGYGNLYERNKSVIGNDPDLIFPGQKITISGGKMTTGG